MARHVRAGAMPDHGGLLPRGQALELRLQRGQGRPHVLQLHQPEEGDLVRGQRVIVARRVDLADVVLELGAHGRLDLVPEGIEVAEADQRANLHIERLLPESAHDSGYGLLHDRAVSFRERAEAGCVPVGHHRLAERADARLLQESLLGGEDHDVASGGGFRPGEEDLSQVVATSDERRLAHMFAESVHGFPALARRVDQQRFHCRREVCPGVLGRGGEELS